MKGADVITLINAASGMASIFCSIRGEFIVAAGFMVMSFILDYFDGRFARLSNNQNGFGKELDSLSDVLSFSVAPAVFGFSLGINTITGIAILIVFVCSGILRLARFNISNIKHFEGMPITVNGVLFPMFYFILLNTQEIINLNYFIIIYLISAALMVSTIKINKI